jgi:DNA-binding NarL/FixJ family response regulator
VLIVDDHRNVTDSLARLTSMDGHEFGQSIKQIAKSARIIVVSGYRKKDARQRSAAAAS